MGTVVTIGIDIGTTSVKAVAVDGDGTILARARVPHLLMASDAGELAHDAAEAWFEGVRAALAAVALPEFDVAAVNVAAMVPSMCAVDADGRPISPGLLYGDARGADADRGAGVGKHADPSSSGELVRFLAWLVEHYPDAAGYWPAQAVANAALSGIGAIDTVTAMTTLPLFDYTSWDAAVAAGAGLSDTTRLPVIVSGSDPVGPITFSGPAEGAPLAGGTIDAFGEQLVAGANETGDVLVIVGATLITWAVIDEWLEFPGLWTVPHTAPGKVLVGGASNAGGLFVNWVRRLLSGRSTDTVADAARIPVWIPHVRGERVPFHDPTRRASLHGLDIGMGAAETMRAAYEASGCSIRHQLDIAGVSPNRLVLTGGGTQDARWVQAIVDMTGLPADLVMVPEGGALGTAYLARVTAGLEASAADAGRWARTASRVEPDPSWRAACDQRYGTYRSLLAALG